ncbi:acyl carrier protein [Kitasatospora sp. NPDC058032]|uniref:acyl carrier protein n=1 Tax=unclassified Kitasatospora TaxID=2633591 RepID=UPI0033B06F65
MSRITIEDLTRIMRECAGEDEAVDLDGDIADTPFEELGYDSLALLEAVARVEREYGVKLADDLAGTAETPRQFVDLVNDAVPAAV